MDLDGMPDFSPALYECAIRLYHHSLHAPAMIMPVYQSMANAPTAKIPHSNFSWPGKSQHLLNVLIILDLVIPASIT